MFLSLLAQTTNDLESVLDNSSSVDLNTVTNSVSSPWAALAGLFSGGLLVIDLAVYAYYALVLQFIAKKTNTPNGWFAWVPILNIVLMLQIAKMPIWYIILFLIPIVNIIIGIMIWIKIFETCGKPGWWVILLFIPVVNLIIMGITAFGNDAVAPVAPSVPSAPAQQ